jgi:hypothetical protein
MEPKNLIIWAVFSGWLIIAVIVIGYPLITGRIRVGFSPVFREYESRRFWFAYLFSTVLFLVVSAAGAFFVSTFLR